MILVLQFLTTNHLMAGRNHAAKSPSSSSPGARAASSNSQSSATPRRYKHNNDSVEDQSISSAPGSGVKAGLGSNDFSDEVTGKFELALPTKYLIISLSVLHRVNRLLVWHEKTHGGNSFSPPPCKCCKAKLHKAFKLAHVRYK